MKVFEGEMIMRTIVTALLQMIWEIVPESEVMLKGIPGPGDDFFRKSIVGD